MATAVAKRGCPSEVWEAPGGRGLLRRRSEPIYKALADQTGTSVRLEEAGS